MPLRNPRYSFRPSARCCSTPTTCRAYRRNSQDVITHGAARRRLRDDLGCEEPARRRHGELVVRRRPARRGCVDDRRGVCANSVPVENDMIPGTADAVARIDLRSRVDDGVRESRPDAAQRDHRRQPRGPRLHGEPALADPFVVPTPAQHDVVPRKRCRGDSIQPSSTPPDLARLAPGKGARQIDQLDRVTREVRENECPSVGGHAHLARKIS